ncbi:MAG TPA: hypothetical protein VFE05_12255 [Longimicrobiaceae bacterium]|jgi:hypothetical protein|nr:hypothetical protein [Longimicrobiaceae bacterium]
MRSHQARIAGERIVRTGALAACAADAERSAALLLSGVGGQVVFVPETLEPLQIEALETLKRELGI